MSFRREAARFHRIIFQWPVHFKPIAIRKRIIVADCRTEHAKRAVAGVDFGEKRVDAGKPCRAAGRTTRGQAQRKHALCTRQRVTHFDGYLLSHARRRSAAPW